MINGDIPVSVRKEVLAAPASRAVSEAMSQLALFLHGLNVPENAARAIGDALYERLAETREEDINNVTAGLHAFASWSLQRAFQANSERVRDQATLHVSSSPDEAEPTPEGGQLPVEQAVLAFENSNAAENDEPVSSESEETPEGASSEQRGAEPVVSSSLRTLMGKFLDEEQLHALVSDMAEKNVRTEQFLSGVADSVYAPSDESKKAKMTQHLQDLLEGKSPREIAVESNKTTAAIYARNHDLGKKLAAYGDAIRELYAGLYDSALPEKNSEELIKDESAEQIITTDDVTATETQTADEPEPVATSIKAPITLPNDTPVALHAVRTGNERKLEEEPPYVQFAVRYARQHDLEGRHQVALREFLNPKSRGDLTVPKLEVVKKLQGDIVTFLDVAAEGEEPTKHQMHLLRRLFGIEYKSGSFAAGPNVEQLGTLLSGIRTNGGGSNEINNITQELFDILDKVLAYSVPAEEQTA